MDYLQNRVRRFKQFQEIIDQPETKQCGRKLTLQIDGDVIEPDFRLLGLGAFGVALGLEHPVLRRKELDIALKISSSQQNQDELKYNLLFSDLVEKGGIPNFPLYSRCKNLGKAEGDCDCGSCEFKNTILNPEEGKTVREIFRKHISEDIPVRECLVTFSERVDGNFGQYLQRKIQLDGDLAGVETMFSAFGQVVFALEEFHARGLAHNDSHVGNIFLKRLDDKNNYIRYNAVAESYTVRVGNALAMLADFGLVRKLEPPSLIISGDRGFMDAKINGILAEAGLPPARVANWYHSAIHDAFLFLMFIISDLQRVGNRYPVSESVVRRFATRIIDLSNRLSAQEQIRYRPVELLFELESVLEEPALSIWKATVNKAMFPKGPVLGTYQVGVVQRDSSAAAAYSSKAAIQPSSLDQVYSSKAAAKPAYSSAAAVYSSLQPAKYVSDPVFYPSKPVSSAVAAYSSKAVEIPPQPVKYVSDPVFYPSKPVSSAAAKPVYSSPQPVKYVSDPVFYPSKPISSAAAKPAYSSPQPVKYVYPSPKVPVSPPRSPRIALEKKQKIPTAAQLIQMLKKSSSCRSKLKKCKKSGCKSMRRKCSPKRK